MISYLQTDNVSRRIGDNLLFENINLNINKDDRIAIVGVNGSGKTSLLDIITGKESPDTGAVNKLRDLTVSYLEQTPALDENNSVIDELLGSENIITDIIRDYEKSLVSEDGKLIQRMIQKMDDSKAWDYEVSVKQILSRLKLTDINARIASLSGGEKKRVALARVLVKKSDLLVLDEPTNHLDIDMIEWLEEYLLSRQGTVLMVTHDRYFLDRICNVIFEISDKRVSRYEGNYGYFLTKKQENETSARANLEKTRNLYRSELEWMRRMPKARRHKAKSRIQAFSDIEEGSKGSVRDKAININVDASRMGKKILVIKNISKSFGEKTLVKDFSYVFTRFEKVGLVGKNGTGKTTLLNILEGNLLADSGSVEKGVTVKFAYYRQDGIVFDEEMTVADAASKIAEKVTLSDGNVVSVSQFLNYFLFPPDRQRTFIRKLSGGEKRRLYLLTVLMQSPNFLLLDEPTNDLDILTLNVLEEYLANFRGCVIVASHDRYFMDKVADHVFEYRGNGIIKDFPGNYTQLRNSRPAQEDIDETEGRVNKPVLKARLNIRPEKARKSGLTFREKKELELLECEIKEADSERQVLENEIISGRLSAAELHSVSEKLSQILRIIDEKELRWLELSER